MRRDSSPQNQKYIRYVLPVELFISQDSFGVSCLVFEISAAEICASCHGSEQRTQMHDSIECITKIFTWKVSSKHQHKALARRIQKTQT